MRAGERLYTLDGLRGVCALLVVLCHLEPLVNIAPGGYLAVDFFFALSGIVIAENYGPRLNAGMRWRTFNALRFGRVYPLFLVGLILGLGRAISQVLLRQPTALGVGEITLAFCLGVLMLPSVSTIPPIYPLLTPAWTLLFELLANIVYAVGMRRWRLRILAGLCLVCAVALWFVRDPAFGLNIGGSWATFHVGLIRVGFSFTLGVIMYEAILRRRTPWSSWAAVLPVAAAIVIMVIDVPATARGTLDWLCVVLALPVLVLLAALWNTPRPLRPLFHLLGQISYPIYAIHYPLIFVATFAAKRWRIGTALWVPGLIAGLVVLSYLLARYYDAPARSWLRRATTGRAVTPR